MSQTFHLPDLGEGLSSAVIREWRVQVGDDIQAEDIVCTVETAKAVVELPSPLTGTIDHCHVQSGETVPTGAALCSIVVEGTSSKTDDKKPATVVGSLTSDADHLTHEVPNTGQTHAQAYAAPAARAYAKVHNLDFDGVKGSGPNGLIVLADLAQQQNHKSSEMLDPHRAQMYAAMQRANACVMQTTVTDVVPLQHQHGITIDLLMALRETLAQHPIFNATWSETDGLIMHDAIDIGLAMHHEKKLYVPILRALQQHTRTSLSEAMLVLKQCLVNHHFSPDMLAAPRFVLSNFGALGAGIFATPVVVPPGLAIMAVGRTMAAPIWCDIQNTWHKGLQLPVSLTFDHRLITGGEAAIFLNAFKTAFTEHHATSVA